MKRGPNVLVIAVDTLRADHLGCYGHPRPTSPCLDRLAAQGVLCERLYCAAIPTQPSFTTLYTGQHPITHRIVCHGGSEELARNAPFLPELFLQAGYTTCAVDNLWRGRPWFGRGHEFYLDPSLHHAFPIAVTCDEINERATAWLREHAGEPFFMLVHYWDPHYPLNPPARLRHLFYDGDPTDPDNRSLDAWWNHPLGALARDTWLQTGDGQITDADYVEALYDQEIRYVDEGIGRLVDTVDGLGLTDQTLVVVTADHGESMTEHGIFFAHHGLYDCTIHVPLIFRWPAHLAGDKRVPDMLPTPGLAPTICEAAGLPIPEAMDGRSFWPSIAGEADGGCSRVISAECSWQAKWSLRSDRHKLILAREPDLYGTPMRELYDLATDPGERDDLSDREPELADSLEQELEAWIAERLRRLGRTEDPLREQGVSLKAVWH